MAGICVSHLYAVNQFYAIISMELTSIIYIYMYIGKRGPACNLIRQHKAYSYKACILKFIMVF